MQFGTVWRLTAIASTIALAACGEGDGGSASNLTGSGSSGADAAAVDAKGAACGPTALPTGGQGSSGGGVSLEPLTVATKVNVEGKLQQASLQGGLYKPDGCSAAKPCPLVVLVPGHEQEPWPTWGVAAYHLAKSSGAIVIVFNPPGRGKGAFQSEGQDDVGGIWAATALKDVMHLKSSRADVDKAHLGFVSIGTGLITVAAALKVHGEGSLKPVQFLLDVEGPVGRCDISQAAEDVGKSVGPGDGGGATDSACHYDIGKHEEQFPAAQGCLPASIVCAPGAWPISQTGQDCKANSWWVEREPWINLSSLKQRYWRLQFQYDHQLPSPWSALLALKAVGKSVGNKFRGLNDFAPCQIPTATQCIGNPDCWLHDAWGNGMAPAPYAGGKLQPISLESLGASVLPTYLGYLMDEKLQCK
jgi:hypothetical protein